MRRDSDGFDVDRMMGGRNNGGSEKTMQAPRERSIAIRAPISSRADLESTDEMGVTFLGEADRVRIDM